MFAQRNGFFIGFPFRINGSELGNENFLGREGADARSRKPPVEPDIAEDRFEQMSDPAGNGILGDFIPFYFGVRMPMLYVVQHGGNFVSEAFRPNNIVYVVVRLNSILSSGFTYYFSDGHGTDRLTTFYDSSKIDLLPSIIDWNAVTARKWGGEDVEIDIKRRKQAEFLVGDDIPSDLIFGFVCCDESSKDKLVSMGVKNEIIKIFPNAYYL